MQIYVSLRHVGGLGEHVTWRIDHATSTLMITALKPEKWAAENWATGKFVFSRGLFRFRYFRQFCVALFLTISIFVAQFSRCPIFCCPFSRCRFFLLPFSVAVISHIIFLLPCFPTLSFFVADFSNCSIFPLPFFPFPFLPFTVNIIKAWFYTDVKCCHFQHGYCT